MSARDGSKVKAGAEHDRQMHVLLSEQSRADQLRKDLQLLRLSVREKCVGQMMHGRAPTPADEVQAGVQEHTTA